MTGHGWIDDHHPRCPPYLGAREGRAECAVCEALALAESDERERIATALEAWDEWDAFGLSGFDLLHGAVQIVRGDAP